MNTAQILVISSSLLGFCGVLPHRMAAQDDPTPKEPLISRAPEMSAWTMTYRYKQTDANSKPDGDSKQKSPDQIVSVQMQKTGKIYHRVTTWSSGSQMDAWTIGSKEVVKGKLQSNYVLLPNEGSANDDYSKSDFEELGWISMKQYTGLKKGDQPVFVFQAKNSERPLTRREKSNLIQMKMSSPPPADAPASSPNSPNAKTKLDQMFGDAVATVVLDAKNQLPVAYDDGRTVCVYQFATPPVNTLVPPAEVVNILHRLEDYTKRSTVRPSAP